MSASQSKKTNSTAKTSEQCVDVLYQKLGENWFAFSLIDDEVFMSPVSDDKIAEIKSDTSAVAKIRASNAETDREAA
jgi:hypothetical protein